MRAGDYYEWSFGNDYFNNYSFDFDRKDLIWKKNRLRKRKYG